MLIICKKKYAEICKNMFKICKNMQKYGQEQPALPAFPAEHGMNPAIRQTFTAESTKLTMALCLLADFVIL